MKVNFMKVFDITNGNIMQCMLQERGSIKGFTDGSTMENLGIIVKRFYNVERVVKVTVSEVQ